MELDFVMTLALVSATAAVAINLYLYLTGKRDEDEFLRAGLRYTDTENEPMVPPFEMPGEIIHLPKEGKPDAVWQSSQSITLMGTASGLGLDPRPFLRWADKQVPEADKLCRYCATPFDPVLPWRPTCPSCGAPRRMPK